MHLFANQKCFIIPTYDLCLLAILNSKVTTKWFEKTLPLLRGAFYEPSSIFMQNFPVPDVSAEARENIICLLRQILANPDSPDVPRLEAEIERLVYQLYNLTPEEIALVEHKTKD